MKTIKRVKIIVETCEVLTVRGELLRRIIMPGIKWTKGFLKIKR